jgi:hypothetical protein
MHMAIHGKKGSNYARALLPKPECTQEYDTGSRGHPLAHACGIEMRITQILALRDTGERAPPRPLRHEGVRPDETLA